MIKALTFVLQFCLAFVFSLWSIDKWAKIRDNQQSKKQKKNDN